MDPGEVRRFAEELKRFNLEIQNRMSLDGEAFLQKYGAQAAADAPPIARIRAVPVSRSPARLRPPDTTYCARDAVVSAESATVACVVVLPSVLAEDVTAPWPLAEVARQHDERMDCSGYPRGLKGDGIARDARVPRFRMGDRGAAADPDR